jgi:hypothetical protein
MKFIVNQGQRIPYRPEGHGGGTLFYTGGEIVEGPTWWAREFNGRMTPLDDQGNKIDLAHIEAMQADLESAKAHERVTLLEDIISRSQGMIRDALMPELEKAKAEAAASQEEFAKKQKLRRTGESSNDDRGVDLGGPNVATLTEGAQMPEGFAGAPAMDPGIDLSGARITPVQSRDKK